MVYQHDQTIYFKINSTSKIESGAMQLRLGQCMWPGSILCLIRCNFGYLIGK
jgi:hypothetical protein